MSINLFAKIVKRLYERLYFKIRAEFPNKTAVHVDHPRFHGLGEVYWNNRGECPHWCIPVLLENGNVWWYEAWTVRK